MSRKSVLVTGASGMIGTRLIEQLFEEGHAPRGVDVVPNRWSEQVDDVTARTDLTEENLASELPSDVDVVVHLGGFSKVGASIENPEQGFANYEMTYRILEYAREVGADVVFASSYKVYGPTPDTPLTEDMVDVEACASPYAASKAGGEALIAAYRRSYDIDARVVRFTNVYGQYDASRRVVPIFIARAAAGLPLVVEGPEQGFDFTHVDDCVRGITKVIETIGDVEPPSFQIASGEGFTLGQLAETVADHVGKDPDIRHESDQHEDQRYVADISRAREYLGYEPKYPPHLGIERAVEWYLEHPDVLEEIRSN